MPRTALEGDIRASIYSIVGAPAKPDRGELKKISGSYRRGFSLTAWSMILPCVTASYRYNCTQTERKPSGVTMKAVAIKKGQTRERAPAFHGDGYSSV